MITVNPLVYKQDKRVAQQDILPRSIKGRNISNTAIAVSETTSFVPTAFGNGQTLRLTSTRTQLDEQPILVEKYWSAYIGTVIEANNIFGNSISTTGLNIRGPVEDQSRWDGTKYTAVSTLIIQNVSAGSITVTAFVREKIFVLAPKSSNSIL